jgi:protein-S-isoprenylcysteine O-methyltransferase Ste14
MHNFIVLSLFALFGLVVIWNTVNARKKGHRGVGTLPIHKGLFILGKICMGVTWAFFIGQALNIHLTPFPVPPILSWLGTGLLSIGIPFVVLAFFQLGTQGKFGLSDEKAHFVTTGIFRVTRNPMYLGFFLLSIASCIYCPNVVNPICAVIAIAIHHKIVLGEEAFLSQQFPDQWIQYATRVRRYL